MGLVIPYKSINCTVDKTTGKGTGYTTYIYYHITIV